MVKELRVTLSEANSWNHKTFKYAVDKTTMVLLPWV